MDDVVSLVPGSFPDLDAEALEIDLSALVRRWGLRQLAAHPPAGFPDPAGFAARLDVGDVTRDEQRAFWLVKLSVLKALGRTGEGLQRGAASAAAECGASTADIGEALGISRQAVEKRWGTVQSGIQEIVVISRRARSYPGPEGDSREFYGEVGGPDQYESDRGWWPVGKRVRDTAKYAVIGVEFEVKRVYRITPGAWTGPNVNRKWQFSGIELLPDEVDSAYDRGELPVRLGDPCQTRWRRSYWPARFRLGERIALQ